MVHFFGRKPEAPALPTARQLDVLIVEMLERLMADTTALTAATQALTAAVAANAAAVEDVKTIVATGSAGDKAAVDAATQVVTDATTGVNANTAALEALKPAPVTTASS